MDAEENRINSTMLVVDDNELNRQVLRLLFEKSYTVLEAETGKEALEVLESCRGNIDIVLLDLIMPEIDGMEMLRRRPRLDFFVNVPVVVITASSDLTDQITAFELGANDFISKPFVPEIVRSRVNNVMSAHRRMASIELQAQSLKQKSEIDQMTHLYNKTTTESAISEILLEQPGKLHALLVIDIDNFKSVNDLSGHLAGDHTIRIVADLISSMFRKSDIIGRVGGDEFAVLMADIPSMEIARSKANELVQLMKYKPNLTIPENVTLSIGIASNARMPVPYAELFERADDALYLAKENGKARAQEDGVEPPILSDDRSAVLLLSRSRSVCSIVHALLPMELRVIEALRVSDLAHIAPAETGRIVMAYIDATEVQGEPGAFWASLKEYPWLASLPYIAICQESNLAQYAAAIAAGAGDVLSDPLEQASFKRRTLRLLSTVDTDAGTASGNK